MTIPGFKPPDWPVLDERPRDVIDIDEQREQRQRSTGRTLLKSSLGSIPLTPDQAAKPPEMQDRAGTLGDEFSA